MFFLRAIQPHIYGSKELSSVSGLFLIHFLFHYTILSHRSLLLSYTLCFLCFAPQVFYILFIFFCRLLYPSPLLFLWPGGVQNGCQCSLSFKLYETTLDYGKDGRLLQLNCPLAIHFSFCTQKVVKKGSSCFCFLYVHVCVYLHACVYICVHACQCFSRSAGVKMAVLVPSNHY